ncbi:MAG TPA: MFS transporter, partial [Acidimicrobiales bacterium]|nr:MFS transporter [Acidimicrobiales bacterium]
MQLGAFVLILGIPDGSLGVLWPSMRATFHLPLDDLGLLGFAGTVLYMAGGLIGNRAQAVLGVGGSMIASCAVAVVALAAWTVSPAWVLLLGAVGLLGLSRGVIDAVLNADAALDGGVRRLGLLHASWAVGGTIGPLLVAAVLAFSHDWRLAVAITAAAVVALLPVAVAERRALNRARDVAPERALPPAALLPPRQPRRPRRALVLTVVAFVLYTAAESGPVAWGYTYLISDRHISHTAAAFAMALFWAALTAGRLALAAVGSRFSPTGIVEVSCLLLVAGTAMLWLLPGASDVLGLPVAGAGAAAVFPMLMALIPERIGEHRTGHAVGASISAAALGGPVAVAA